MYEISIMMRKYHLKLGFSSLHFFTEPSAVIFSKCRFYLKYICGHVDVKQIPPKYFKPFAGMLQSDPFLQLPWKQNVNSLNVFNYVNQFYKPFSQSLTVQIYLACLQYFLRILFWMMMMILEALSLVLTDGLPHATLSDGVLE